MSFSISSLILTCVISGIMIFLIDLILTHRNLFIWLKSDALILLTIVTILRLCAPFELFYTRTIQFPLLLNPIMEFMWYEIYPDIPVSNILWFLWIAIAVIKLVIYINRISQMRSIVKKISENSEKTSVRELLHDPTLEDYPVYISELIDSPKIIGYKRNIYLPKVKYSNNQLDNIINHEIQHIRHFDFFKKQLLELLIIIYWWFPPVYLLRKQYHIYSELRADGFAVKDTSEYEHLKYAQTLIEVQMVLCNEKKDSFNRYSTMFIADGVQTLKWRIESLNSRSFIKRSNILILFFIAIIPFFTNCVIFEPKFSAPTGEYIDEEQWLDSYLLKIDEEEYYLVSENAMILVSDINDPILKGIPIKESVK